jgi:putative transposase
LELPVAVGRWPPAVDVDRTMNRPATGTKPAEAGWDAGRGMPYWRLDYHLVWATWRRLPLIDLPRESLIHRIMKGKASELGVVLRAIGNTDDHVHMVAAIPPNLAVAECVRQLKGASSHALNHSPACVARFRWQEGYGALTVGEQSLPTVVQYVLRQKEHHRLGSVEAVYEHIG